MTAPIVSRTTGHPMTEGKVHWLGQAWHAESVVSPDAGELWEREAERSDSDICPACWGINPPEGVTMVEEDGAVCDCDHEAERGPLIARHPYWSSGKRHPGSDRWSGK
jgi:hypothetical protein